MSQQTVDLNTNKRGVLFNARKEVESAGWSTDDPYPRFLELLEEAPIHKGSIESLLGQQPQFSRMWPDREAYSVLSYDLVNEAFMDAETFNNDVYDFMTKTRIGDTLLNMNAPRHTHMRNISKPYFKPSFVQTWWNDNWINRAVDKLFDQITTKDHADLNLELCAPLPISVVSLGFGVPASEALALRQAAHDLSLQLTPESVAAANQEINRIMLSVIAQRRQKPEDDLISKFIAGELKQEDGSTRGLTDEEIMHYCLLIIFAGGGTTWRQLGIAIMALLDNPDQLEALRADRSLLRSAVHESTRWCPTAPVFLRWVAKDTVLGGMEIKAGSIVHLCLATANRDRSQWEDPDSFNILRPIKRHFAFGAGPHACLGQHLSRQEMEVALNGLLDRLPNLRWDTNQPHPEITGGSLISRGPESLPVRFDL